MNSFKTNKFKKGDKVIRVGDTSAIGVEFGEVYTIDNPSSHSGFYGGEVHNHVTLVAVESTPSDKYLELYVEQRNYREMNPNDLITISVEGIESEVPLGDIVHAVAILGITNGYHGGRIWEALRKPFDTECFVEDMDTVVEFRDKQKEALDYFFKPYYDKQQEKDELKTLIESKIEDVDALVKQLNQLNHMKESGVKIISGSTALVEYKKGSVIMCLPFGLNPEQCTRSDWDTVHHLKEKDFTNNSYIFKLEE